MPRVSEGCLPSDYMDYMKGSNSNTQDQGQETSLKEQMTNNFQKFRRKDSNGRDNDLNVSSPGMVERGILEKN